MRTLACLVLITACGDNTPPTITATVYEQAPAFVGYYTVEDGWQKPELRFGPNNELEYRITTRGVYRLVVTCVGDSGDFETRELIADVSDGAQSITAWQAYTLAGGCTQVVAPDPSDTTPRIKVEGEMAQAGEVDVGYYSDGSATGPWHFTAWKVPGAYDVIASDSTFAPTRFAIRRAVDLHQAAVLPAIDLDVEGNELASARFSFPDYIATDTGDATTRARDRDRASRCPRSAATWCSEHRADSLARSDRHPNGRLAHRHVLLRWWHASWGRFRTHARRRGCERGTATAADQGALRTERCCTGELERLVDRLVQVSRADHLRPPQPVRSRYRDEDRDRGG